MQTIYCPFCNRKVMSYDGKGTMNIDGKCYKCNLIVVYHPKLNVVSTKKIPSRKTSSGTRLY